MEDEELLEELRKLREKDNKLKKFSFTNLFKERKIGILNSAVSVVSTIMGIIIIATIWWANTNNRLESLESQLTNINEQIAIISEKEAQENKELRQRINELENEFNRLILENDKKHELYEVDIEKELNKLQEKINSLQEKFIQTDDRLKKSEKIEFELRYRLQQLEKRLDNIRKEL